MTLKTFKPDINKHPEPHLCDVLVCRATGPDALESIARSVRALRTIDPRLELTSAIVELTSTAVTS